MRATKIIRSRNHGYWEVQVFDGKYYWLDVAYDPKYKELNIDWNQYIFYNTDEDDMARKAFQEDSENFEAAIDEVYSCLLSEGEIKDIEDGYEIAVETWNEKIWDIRQ
jgi:hypothetical protein